MASLGVCLSLVSALHVAPVFVPTTEFTLAWTHSIEKVRWEEDYEVALNAQQQPVLIATKARVKGSAAGMEPPPDSVLHDGWFVYVPGIRAPLELLLTRSEFTPDYDWCKQGFCQKMSTFIASDKGLTMAKACFSSEISRSD